MKFFHHRDINLGDLVVRILRGDVLVGAIPPWSLVQNARGRAQLATSEKQLNDIGNIHEQLVDLTIES